ncbi:aldehyde dehydrogenase [Amylostereum chailletii]|nr:aldehyde dehydrogenase [Amylostereum chailletii]
MTATTSLPFVPLLIGGQHRPSSTGATYPVYNPYTNSLVASAAAASSDDCRAAIEAAHAALPGWEATPLQVKRNIFLRAAAIMESEAWMSKVEQAFREDVAGTRLWGTGSARLAAGDVRAAASLVSALKGETFPSVAPGGHAFVQRRAHGVIYSVIPWNGPVPLTIRGAAIPVICGNTVIIRPSEFGPRAHALVLDAFHQAGLPAGVMNLLPMSTEDTPKLTSEIISHPFVKTITFTGSEKVARIIAAQAGQHLKPCVLELGGKAASIVLADANIKEAAKAIVFAGMVFSGQVCMSTERVIVERAASEGLLAEIKDLVASLTTGSPEDALVSSLFTEAHAESVVGLLRDAREMGAEVIAGDLKRDGTLVKPHVLTGVKRGMRLWVDESFGPVLAVAVVDTVDEAVRLANDTEYTLTASIWTNNLQHAMQTAMSLRTGAVNINGGTIHVEEGHIIEGLGGGSGYGTFNIEQFTHKRVITLHPEKQQNPWFA